jgi:hypothetical protein
MENGLPYDGPEIAGTARRQQHIRLQGDSMKSKFIGANAIGLYKPYSRADLGFKGTRLPGMKITPNEVILFVNLGDKYDNRLTKSGLIHEPGLPKHIFSKPQKITYYLFLRYGNKGAYYYVGISNSQAKYGNTYNMFDFNASGIPVNIVKELGGFQPLP